MDRSNFFLNDTLIVIVLYKIDLRESIAFKTMKSTVHKLEHIAPFTFVRTTYFAYDNSPNRTSVVYPPNIIYKHDPENHGVGRAYNEGFSLAAQFQKKWLLLLDQDSEITFSALQAYHEGILANPGVSLFAPMMEDKLGLVSPFRFRYGRGHRLKKISPGIHSLHDVLIINSGMLVSREAFQKSGGFDERFPLDLSDIVFLERFRMYHSNFFLLNSTCHHNLSAHNMNTQYVLNRFKIYCQAMRLYQRMHRNKIGLKVVVIFRSIKLFFRHRNYAFLRIGMNIK